MTPAPAQWDLAVTNGLRVQIGLKNTIRSGIRGHPDVSAAQRHSAGVLRFGLHRLQKFAVPVHQAGVSGLLLGDPPSFRRHGNRVRISLRTLFDVSDFSL